MLKGNRLTAITAGLTLILAFAFSGYILGFGLGEQSGERDAKTSTYAQHAQDEITSTCAGLDGISQTECIIRVVEATNEHKRSESDLDAQRNMAKWALFMLIATVAMAITTVIGVYYVWQTLQATKAIGRNQTRAYIAIRISDVVLQAGKPFSAMVKAQNCGSTPAVGLRVLANVKIDTAASIGNTSVGAIKSQKSDVGSLVEPGGNCHIMLDTEDNALLSVQDILDIIYGNKIIRGFVYVPYKDIFDNQCWTRKDFELSGEYGVRTGNVIDKTAGPNSDCG